MMQPAGKCLAFFSQLKKVLSSDEEVFLVMMSLTLFSTVVFLSRLCRLSLSVKQAFILSPEQLFFCYLPRNFLCTRAQILGSVFSSAPVNLHQLWRRFSFNQVFNFFFFFCIFVTFSTVGLFLCLRESFIYLQGTFFKRYLTDMC